MTAFHPRFAISMVISAAVGISSAAPLVPPDAKAGMHENSSGIKKLDADQDGKIEIEEFYKAGPEPLHPRMKKVFDTFDKERTGTLSYENTLKVIREVNGLRPKLAPDVDGTFQPISLEVSPKTKRAMIKATVNGVEGRFLLDTGTSDTIVNTDFAERAGVDFVEICTPIAAGNYGKKGDIISMVRVPDMEISGTHFRDFHAVLMKRDRTYEFVDPKLDGVMGANVLFAKQVTIDSRKRTITFTNGVPENVDFTFDLIPEYRKIAAVHADLDGEKIVLMFDSGAAIGDAILINEPYHAALRKLAGNEDSKTYRAKEVRVGAQVIAPDIQCLLRPFEETVIGSYFFDRHIITVNTKTNKIWLENNP